MTIRDWLADAGTWRWARMLARRRLRRDDVEDVVQQTALKAWRLAETYDAERGRRTQWLGSILRSETVSRLREIAGHPGRSAAQARRLGRIRPAAQRVTPAIVDRRMLTPLEWIVIEEANDHRAENYGRRQRRRRRGDPGLGLVHVPERLADDQRGGEAPGGAMGLRAVSAGAADGRAGTALLPLRAGEVVLRW